MPAKCDRCDQPMTKGATCTGGVYDMPNGETVKRVPYLDSNPSGTHLTCHDCGVRLGGYHHPGCDAERCGKCGGQAIACPCNYTEDEEDDGPQKIRIHAQEMAGPWETIEQEDQEALLNALVFAAKTYVGPIKWWLHTKDANPMVDQLLKHGKIARSGHGYKWVDEPKGEG